VVDGGCCAALLCSFFSVCSVPARDVFIDVRQMGRSLFMN